MLVAFWSTHHGQACTTTNAAIVACAAAQLQKGKMLLAHAQTGRGTLESCFLDEKALRERDAGDFAHQGMDALLRLVRNGRLRNEMIPDYAWSLMRDHRMDLLPGTRKDALPAEDAGSDLGDVFRCADGFYDYVLVDVHSGLEAKGTRSLLEVSGLVFLCVNQNKALLDACFASDRVVNLLGENKVVVLVSRYDPNAGMSLRDIQRFVGRPGIPVLPIPYRPAVMGACGKGRLYEYVARHVEDKKSPDYPLMQALHQVATHMVRTAEAQA